MNQNFYLVNAKLSYGRSPIKIQAYEDYESFEHLSDQSPLVENNKFKVDSGKKWFDVIQFADSFMFAISEKLKNILESEKITGWNCFPIEIENYPEQKFYAFYVTEVVGKLTNLKALSNYKTEKHEFNWKTWNGSDFFTNQDTINVVCNEKVKLLFEKNKIENLDLNQY